MTSGTPQTKLRKIFRAFDSNGDKAVSKEELGGVAKALFKFLAGGNLPSSEEGCSPESLVRILNFGPILQVFTLYSPLLYTQVDSALSEMDTDSDGRVTQKEFVEAILRREECSQMLAKEVAALLGDTKNK